MSAPTVSVVVCAYTLDRWSDVVDAVASIRAQDRPADEIILVIDHNDDLLARSRETFDDGGVPAVTVVTNTARQGLSGARNTAITLARGEVLVFLDDDAAAEPGWLAALLAPYAESSVLGVGGAARPRWPVDRPRTLPAPARAGHGELDWVVGCTYAGQPTIRTEVRNLMGCNMSFRRQVFEHVGGFAEDLGRIGRTPLGCEETELCIRVRQAVPGARIVFEPAAAVRHRVSPDRTAWRYLRSRSWAEGVSKAAVSRMVGPSDALSTERGYVLTVLPGAFARELAGAVRTPARLGSAAAIVVSLLWTTAGYARGKWGPVGADRSR